MSDLLLPIVIIVAMYIIIQCLDDALTLAMLAFLFAPISYIFARMVDSGAYDKLFGGTIPAGVSLLMVSLAMITIPIFCIGRIFYIRHLLKKAKEGAENE